MLLVDNEKIADLGEASCALKAFCLSSKKNFELFGEDAIEVNRNGAAAAECYRSQTFLKVVDFDQHLEDVSLDFFNQWYA